MVPAGPNVVWITLESVRADHASVHGYERETTPNMERIAEASGGAAFPHCFSQSMWTPASSASMLTGTHLFRHRVGLDGEAEEPLPADLQTLPELLSEAGYLTACLSPNAYLTSATGLDRGFERFRWLRLKELHRHRETLGPLLRYAARSFTYGHGPTLDNHKHNHTYLMMTIARKWLRSFAREDRPFFLYTHCGNPHYPYAPPRKYLGRFLEDTSLDAEEALELSLRVFESHDSICREMVEGAEFTDDEWAALQGLYDAEIAYADEYVGHLFDLVEEFGLGETIVVVTGDHGELFGEHGLLGHNLVLDDAVTNVPLVTYGLPTGGVEPDDLLQHVDLTRTVAAAAGTSSEQFQGRDLREGAGPFAVSQRGVAQFDSYLEHDPTFDTDRFHAEPTTAIRTDSFRYVESEDRTELFRLPDETTDVSERYPAVRERLRSTLERAVDDPHPSVDDRDADSEFSEAMREQLSDLGYL